MERNENMCLESPSSLTENHCMSTSLHGRHTSSGQLCARHVNLMQSMSECAECFDDKNMIVCDAMF